CSAEEEEEDKEDGHEIMTEKKSFVSTRMMTCLFIVTSFVCFSSVEIPTRLPVSIFTGILLCYGSQIEIALLSNEHLARLGNASYVLYLVHWPVITLYKYSKEVKLIDGKGVILSLLWSILIAIILHNYIELRLLTESKKSIIILVAALYVSILLVTSTELKAVINASVGDTRINYAEALHWNRRGTGPISRGDCGVDVQGAKWASPYWEEKNNRCVAPGNGTARILVLGNSFAGIVVDYLRPLLQSMAKEIRLFAHHGCRILINGTCPRFTRAWHKVVEAMKPDVTWIISREPQLATNPLEEPVGKDPTFQFARDTLSYISTHSKHVVLDYQTVGIIFDHAMFPPRRIIRRISKGNFTFDDLQVTEEDWKTFDRNETRRMDAIENSELIRHKLSEKQCTSGICYFFNPANLHAYYADNYAHPTSEQMALLRPSYVEVIEQLKKQMKI
ncbi:hypothetical protein PMAYCL1PPCAC_09543, partial [Pristionchus mayeri]